MYGVELFTFLPLDRSHFRPVILIFAVESISFASTREGCPFFLPPSFSEEKKEKKTSVS